MRNLIIFLSTFTLTVLLAVFMSKPANALTIPAVDGQCLAGWTLNSGGLVLLILRVMVRVVLGAVLTVGLLSQMGHALLMVAAVVVAVAVAVVLGLLPVV